MKITYTYEELIKLVIKENEIVGTKIGSIRTFGDRTQLSFEFNFVDKKRQEDKNDR